eukprot:g2364.t1
MAWKGSAMTILVFGGTGNVGRPLVEQLVQRDESVRVVSRHETAIVPQGAELFVADFDEPASLSDTFDDVDRVFLLAPVDPRETHRALTTLAEISRHGPDLLVYVSNDLSMLAPQVPHAGSKIGIEAAIRASSLPHVIFRPTCFMQNDLEVKMPLLSGVYPFPMGRHPVARVDVRDVATASAHALFHGKPSDHPVVLSSQDQPNGAETAALWSSVLGRQVICPDQSPEDWAKAMKPILPDWLSYDLMLMYREFQKQGHPLTVQDLDRQSEYLEDAPRGYLQFMSECAKDWAD